MTKEQKVVSYVSSFDSVVMTARRKFSRLKKHTPTFFKLSFPVKRLGKEKECDVSLFFCIDKVYLLSID
jgi:hypothetical protein